MLDPIWRLVRSVAGCNRSCTVACLFQLQDRTHNLADGVLQAFHDVSFQNVFSADFIEAKGLGPEKFCVLHQNIIQQLSELLYLGIRFSDYVVAALRF